MKLTSLEVQGVRGVSDGEYDLAPGGSPQPLTLVTGPHGAGLTSFLNSIAFSSARLSSPGFVPRSEDVLHAGAREATIRSRWSLDDAERQYAGLVDGATAAEVVFKLEGLGHVHADPGLLGLMSRYDHAGLNAKVVCIPQLRITNGASAPFSDFEADQRRQQFSTDPAKFASIPRALLTEASLPGGRRRFEQVQSLFEALSGTVQLAPADHGRLEFSSGSSARIPYRQLSFGERDAFVLAAVTILWGLSNAVVLLDTPELSQPIGRMRQCIDRMMEAAPGSQWIIATRSEELISGQSPQNVIRLERRS